MICWASVFVCKWCVNECGVTVVDINLQNTYRDTLAVDAVHDSKRWTQIRVPSLLQLVGLSAEPTFCNNQSENLSVKIICGISFG